MKVKVNKTLPSITLDEEKSEATSLQWGPTQATGGSFMVATALLCTNFQNNKNLKEIYLDQTNTFYSLLKAALRNIQV